MTPLQFAALHLLVTHAGAIVPKETLLKTVWGDVAVGDNSVERMMSDVRALLDPADRRRYIHTLSRRGYMFAEPTRANPAPERAALAVAETNARRACELKPELAEASATLGVILARRGDRVGAIGALQRASSLDPNDWLHFVRLAEVRWGQARQHAARRVLQQCPGFPMAHWLIASVFVARHPLPLAGLAIVDTHEGFPPSSQAPRPPSARRREIRKPQEKIRSR